MKIKSAGLAVIAVLMTATPALCADWVEVGADTQAKYYVDLDSIKVDGDNVSVLKRGIFTQVLTDTLGGTSATFKETIGTVEIDFPNGYPAAHNVTITATATQSTTPIGTGTTTLTLPSGCATTTVDLH